MSGTDATLLSVHLAATAAMAGLIWFVQVVHYPLFDGVGRTGFAAYEARHTRRTAWVVGPLMAVEGVAAVALFVWPVDGVGRGLPLLAGLVLAAVHTSTITLQVPCHNRLASGFDPAVHTRLVTSNWIRTVGWSTRSVLAVVMLVMAV